MNKKTNQNDSLNFDYSRIQAEVSQNIREQMPQQMPQQKRKPLWKRILLVATYTLLVCAITATSTWGIQKAFASEKTKIIYVNQERDEDDNFYCGTASLAKHTDKFEKFDRYISYGRMTSEELMGSFLLSESDKDFIFHAVEHNRREIGSEFECAVFLGEIDGVDYLYIVRDLAISGIIQGPDDNYGAEVILNCEQCNAIFPDFANFFKSDLEYTLNDLLGAFEQLIGESLTDEFLCALQDTRNTEDYLSTSTGINMQMVRYAPWSYRLGRDLDKYQSYELEKEMVLHEKKGDFSNAKVVQKENGLYEITLEDSDGGPEHYYADVIISIGKDGLVYLRETSNVFWCEEVFYTLYNNQVYVINRSYMLTGQMFGGASR